MSKTTPAERVEQIRKRAEAATPAPWKSLDETLREYRNAAFNPWHVTHVVVPIDGKPMHPGHICKEFIAELKDTKPVMPNAAFIAHARDDIPWLLSELAAAEQRAERVASMLRNAANQFMAQRQRESDSGKRELFVALAKVYDRYAAALAPAASEAGEEKQ